MNTARNFYNHWATDQFKDPLRQITLSWKAVHLANLYRRNIPDCNPVNICEIGGAEGSVLAQVGALLSAKQLVCYDLSDNFVSVGQKLFPHISFVIDPFTSTSEHFDLVVLSDITEHVIDDQLLLREVACKCSYVLLKMPIEESLNSSKFFMSLRGRSKPLAEQYGPNHRHGHLRGYTLASALHLVQQSFEIIDYYLVDISFYGGATRRVRFLRDWLGLRLFVRLFGGSIFILGQSRIAP